MMFLIGTPVYGKDSEGQKIFDILNWNYYQTGHDMADVLVKTELDGIMESYKNKFYSRSWVVNSPVIVSYIPYHDYYIYIDARIMKMIAGIDCDTSPKTFTLGHCLCYHYLTPPFHKISVGEEINNYPPVYALLKLSFIELLTLPKYKDSFPECIVSLLDKLR